MGYAKLKFSPLLICLTLCFYLTISAGEMLDHQEKTEIKEIDLKDYWNTILALFQFHNSINNTVSSLKREIGLQKAEIVSLKSEIADQQSEFANLNGLGTSQQEEILKLKQTVRKLHNLKSNMSWEDFDEVIEGAPKKLWTGNAVSGLRLSEIRTTTSRVGFQGSYTVIVFANHLDETIQNFTIYDQYTSTNYPAPQSIPPHTQEIFTFADKSTDATVGTSFSYAIPSANLRIAAISFHGTQGVGVAFVSNDTNMETYYDTQKGIEGSSVYEEREGMDQYLSVSYKNLHARLFAGYEGDAKATIRIEIIKLPLWDDIRV